MEYCDGKSIPIFYYSLKQQNLNRLSSPEWLLKVGYRHCRNLKH
ncbi:12663_t:CDS:2 [Gigaspora margarita]|uniref:12663_t:CDS:1 n=1 Tax=Gigaspora margarita TaxID=4874 RepID=A0ABM8VZZ5_GIGMA|nr:12663_t:CDS:2 [Gigaspora margarita]